MKNPLCKYCGNEMKMSYIDRYETNYKCECDGYLKERQLMDEISDIKNALNDKEMELYKHQHNSQYSKTIGILERQLREYKTLYRE